VEVDVLTQLEGVLETVLAALPALGEQGGRVGGAGLGADQTLEDLSGDPEGLTVRGEGRVEQLGLCGAGEHEGVTFGVPAVTLGTAGEHEGAGNEAHGPESYA